jgi:acetate kinase
LKILIANPGSTSYKCKLFDMSNETILFRASVDRIGDPASEVTWQWEETRSEKKNIPDFSSAVQQTLLHLEERIPAKSVSAVGFKTVHARGVTGCVELTESVIEAMIAYQPLVPVHTRVYLTAIRAFRQVVPGKPLIGLFETHFHANIPVEAAMYGVPYDWVTRYGVRKYGFHGASHRYIAERSGILFNAEKVISCHLGGSASVCAIKQGQSIDTSMGMSAQCGLLNAKRVGDLDSFALLYVMEQENLSTAQTRDLLISKSGLLGLSGISGDVRDIEQAMDTHERAALAFRAFAYGVKRYIGEYMAILNSADLIAFTGGAGQNSCKLRQTILNNMENIGIILDREKNLANPAEGLISSDLSPVQIAVIPTNEELIVAREVAEWLKKH